MTIGLVFQVPTMGEMVDMWKKNQNLFGIVYSWFLAKACYLFYIWLMPVISHIYFVSWMSI